MPYSCHAQWYQLSFIIGNVFVHTSLKKPLSLKTAVISIKRGQIFYKNERLLSLWIELQAQKLIPTRQLLILKAKSFVPGSAEEVPEGEVHNFHCKL